MRPHAPPHMTPQDERDLRASLIRWLRNEMGQRPRPDPAEVDAWIDELYWHEAHPDAKPKRQRRCGCVRGRF